MKEKLLKCFVIRRADTQDEQMGNEWLTPEEIIQTVNGRVGGNYLTVYKYDRFADITPVTLDYKKDARAWVKNLQHLEALS